MNIEIKINKRPISYKYAIKFLEKRVSEIKEEKNIELLWILEHPLTYTSGIRSKKNEILDKKIKVINTNRGGKITLHNPGQKVIYFAINLNKRKKDIRKFINVIEKSIIDFLRIYNIEGIADKKNVGIWVHKKKIAAIGLRVSRWIAYHGFSINITNDLRDYNKIIPCGLDNKKITSVRQENKKKLLNVENHIAKIFIKNLNKI